MAHLPDVLSDQTAHGGVGPGWRNQIAAQAEWRPRQEVECTLDFVAQYFSLELLLAYHHLFRLETIAAELVAALRIYAVGSPEPQKISCHVVGNLKLVRLIFEVYEITAHCKRHAHRC